MKRFLLLLTFFSLIGGELLAQVPQALQYQAVARNTSGQLVANTNISVKIHIQTSDKFDNSPEFEEVHLNVPTNAYGLFSLQIGSEDPAAFSQINWASGGWYIHLLVDATNPSNVNPSNAIGDPTQLLSVPFALQAGSLSGPTDIALDDLTDVSTQGASNEKVLKYNGSSWVAGDDADSDPTNEIQTLSVTGNDLSISSGNSVTIPGVPAGTMMMFCGPSANIPAGWLECDGASYIKSQYPDLSAAIGIAWGGTGSTFNVPDMRGRFARGMDDGQGRDPDVTTRSASNSGGNTGDAVGSAQDDAFQGHFHGIQIMAGTGGGSNHWVAKGGGTPIPGEPIEAPTTMTYGTGQDYGVPKLSSETRPQNVNVIYIIKE